jgi:hypothetical protein
MRDSDLSAGELRKRYHKGGSVPDDELTSKQLRARHGIPSNSANFGNPTNSGGLSPVLVIGILAVAGLVLYLVFYKD